VTGRADAEAESGSAVAHIAVSPELRFFLKPAARRGPVPVRCDAVSTLGHLVESIGVPLTEVGTMLVGGAQVAACYRPEGGDAVQVLPVARPQRPVPARLILDVHLGTVARWLRLVGVDTAYASDAADNDLIEQANAQHRLLLTRDRGLLMRRKLWRGAFVRGANPREQFADVLDRFAPALAPWTRCPACNGPLAPAAKTDITALLQPGTRRTYEEFARCQVCGQVYWRGAHARRLDQIVEAARGYAAVGGAWLW
jgi:uncharacterized protein